MVCGAVRDLAQHFIQALGTDTAGGALAAAFVHGEFEEELGDIDHAVILVHDDESARTHHGADGDEVIVIDRRIDEVRGDAAARRAARLRRLELFAVGAAAADVVDDLAHGGAHRDLDEAGVVDLAAQREHLGAAALFRTHGGEPIGALEDDLRNVGVRFDVIEDGRFSEQALDRGNGGRGRGSPRCPSMEVISAVSSPQTNAPAPRRMSRSKLKPVPKRFFPSRPYSRACLMAMVRRCTAIGYSART